MEGLANPIQNFRFRAEFEGLDPILIQEVNIPDAEVDVIEHSAGNYSEKTGGRKKFGDVTLKKLKSQDYSDNWAWDWLNEVQNDETGGGKKPSEYRKSFTISELASDNVTTINRWLIIRSFPKSVKGGNKNANESTNTIEEVVLAVTRVKKIK